MALMLCPPVPANCARIVINAAKGFCFTLHVVAAGGGGESRICSDGTSSSSASHGHAPLSIESSRSCGESPCSFPPSRIVCGVRRVTCCRR